MTLSAHRVARRYRSSAVVLRDEPTFDVIMSDGGVVTTADLRRLLEPRLGLLFKMQMRPSLSGSPNTIAWEAHDENAEVVSGKLVLHAQIINADQVQVWAEVLSHEAGSTRLASTVGGGKLLAVLGEHQFVSIDEIKAALEDRYGGPLRHLRLWTALTSAPAPIAVEAMTADGRTLWAEVVVRTSVDGQGVTYWTELRQLPKRSSVVASSLPRQIMKSRLEGIALKARAVMTRLRVQPQTPAHEVIGDIVRIVELAEGE